MIENHCAKFGAKTATQTVRRTMQSRMKTKLHHLGLRDNDYRLLEITVNNGGSSLNSFSLFLCLLDPRHLSDNPIQKLKEGSVADILTPKK